MINNIDKLTKLLESGTNSHLLRFSLGNEYYKEKKFKEALIHLKEAIKLHNEYSAAWKLYAKTLTKVGQKEKAIEAYLKGILIAEQNGDMQALKEMQVFLKRLKK